MDGSSLSLIAITAVATISLAALADLGVLRRRPSLVAPWPGSPEIDLSLVAKKPGPALELDVAHASIPLATLRDADPLPPYVRLIHDVLLGDRSLFTRPDGLAAVWDVAEPLLSRPPEVTSYPPGSWGPDQARELVAPGHWLLGQ